MVHMKTEPAHINTGKIGERIAADYLLTKGYKIIGRNYRKKVGEIDIIASKRGVIYFVEVKTITRAILDNSYNDKSDYRPEDNVHKHKTERLKKTISLYLSQHRNDGSREWQFNVITLEIDQSANLARLNHIKDIVL